MSETCQKLAFTHPIVVLKSELKNNWMKKLDRVNRPLKQWMDTVYNQNVFLLRESNSIMSGNGKGFTLEDLFRSAFTEL